MERKITLLKPQPGQLVLNRFSEYGLAAYSALRPLAGMSSLEYSYQWLLPVASRIPVGGRHGAIGDSQLP